MGRSQRISQLSGIIQLTRPFNTLQPIMLAIVGVLTIGSTETLLYVIAVVILAHSAVTVANDIEDITIDKKNHVQSILTLGGITPRQAWMLAIVMSVLALGCAFFISSLSVCITALILLVGWLYNSKPVQGSRRPIASMVLLAVSYGFLPFFVGLSLSELSIQALLVPLFWMLGRVSLSILKDYKDAVGDAASNKKTFLLVYGHTLTSGLSILLSIVGHIGVSWALYDYIDAPWQASYVVLTAITGVIQVLFRLKLRRVESYAKLNQVFHECLRLQVPIDGMFLIWLML